MNIFDFQNCMNLNSKYQGPRFAGTLAPPGGRKKYQFVRTLKNFKVGTPTTPTTPTPTAEVQTDVKVEIVMQICHQFWYFLSTLPILQQRCHFMDSPYKSHKSCSSLINDEELFVICHESGLKLCPESSKLQNNARNNVALFC